MLLTVQNFCRAVKADINGLIRNVELDTMRYMGDKEKRELEESYKAVATMLTYAQDANANIADVYISTTDVLMEYHLPKASAWCDLVLLGVGDEHPEVIIIELKNYRKNTETREGSFEGLIWHNGNVRQHPSAQVRQYTQYCQFFHSAVVDEKAHCSGLVYFTQDVDVAPYEAGPNRNLCKEYKLYTAEPSSTIALSNYIAKTIKRGDKPFAQKFISGDYKQDRNILKQVAESLMTMRSSQVRNPFVLLDGQDLGFSQVLSVVENLKPEDHKEVIIVAGPPGSGKSAVAANLWVECAQRYRDRGNIMFVTTSSSQYDPWAQTFESNTGTSGASGLVIKANFYNPGLNGTKIKEDIAPHFREIDEEKYFPDGKKLRYDLYKDYLRYANEIGLIEDESDTQYMSIVDEAHALIDPSAPHFSSNKSGGWCYQVGPQAYHIIKQSRVSVFLMDDHQSFRDNETTNINTIRRLAKDFNAHVTFVSLADMQFRCAGSKEYVDWVGRMFTPRPLHNHAKWADKFEFAIVDSPKEVDEWLRSKRTDSIRVLSSYTVPWHSTEKLQPLHGDYEEFDFDLDNGDGTRYRKFWNYGKNQEYRVYIKAMPGSSMANDPLSEVGCPFIVRGYDYDYVGVLSLGDLIIRNGKPKINLAHCQETATLSKKKQAREESEIPFKAAQKLLPRHLRETFNGILDVDHNHPQAWEYASTLAQAYRILLTRGIKGACVYIEDEETRRYVESLLKDDHGGI